MSSSSGCVLFRYTLAAILLSIAVLSGGCRRRSAREAAKTQQAQERADQEAMLAFVKENGEVDWRKRVDAAAEALEEAKSDRRWGRSDKALQHALEAARLLPPPSKDFDSPLPKTIRGTPSDEATEGASGGGASGGGAPGGGASGGSASGGGASEGAGNRRGDDGGGKRGGGGEGTGAHEPAGADDSPANPSPGDAESRESGTAASDASETGPDVTNDEVQRLRESLESLLGSLEGKAGSGKSVNLEREAIEIR